MLVRDRWGATPLDDARREKREAVVDLLENPESVTGLRFTYEPEELRFFQARFESVA